MHFGLLLGPAAYAGWSAVLAGAAAFIATQGIVLAATFAVSHNVDEAKVVEETSGAAASRDWGRQQVTTSANWGGVVGNFFTGGLNLQVRCLPAAAQRTLKPWVKPGNRSTRNPQPAGGAPPLPGRLLRPLPRHRGDRQGRVRQAGRAVRDLPQPAHHSGPLHRLHGQGRRRGAAPHGARREVLGFSCCQCIKCIGGVGGLGRTSLSLPAPCPQFRRADIGPVLDGGRSAGRFTPMPGQEGGCPLSFGAASAR